MPSSPHGRNSKKASPSLAGHMMEALVWILDGVGSACSTSDNTTTLPDDDGSEYSLSTSSSSTSTSTSTTSSSAHHKSSAPAGWNRSKTLRQHETKVMMQFLKNEPPKVINIPVALLQTTTSTSAEMETELAFYRTEQSNQLVVQRRRMKQGLLPPSLPEHLAQQQPAVTSPVEEFREVLVHETKMSKKSSSPTINSSSRSFQHPTSSHQSSTSSSASTIVTENLHQEKTQVHINSGNGNEARQLFQINYYQQEAPYSTGRHIVSVVSKPSPTVAEGELHHQQVQQEPFDALLLESKHEEVVNTTRKAPGAPQTKLSCKSSLTTSSYSSLSSASSRKWKWKALLQRMKHKRKCLQWPSFNTLRGKQSSSFFKKKRPVNREDREDQLVSGNLNVAARRHW